MIESFIFGGDAPMTYEQLQRQRKIAERLMSANSQTPRNAGEGIAAIGRALAAGMREKKANQREKELRGEFDAKIAGMLAPSQSSGNQPSYRDYSSTPPFAPDATDPMQYGGQGYALGDSANMGELVDSPMGQLAMGTNVQTEATPAAIRAGLIARGLPDHVADGFIMNMKDESGFNPDINEAAPIVPGSRGGYGLIQWTGPRRKQLEAYAQSRGVPVSDVDLQLDFLMHELGGSESAAAREIMSAQDAGSAAQAIVNKFLRPAEAHRAHRAAQYGNMDIGQLASLAGNPMASPAQRQIIGALLDRQMQASDPMYQMQMEKGQLELDQMRSPQMTPFQQAQLDIQRQRMNAPAKPPSSVAEYEYARENPDFIDYQKTLKQAGSTKVNVGDGETAFDKEMGKKYAEQAQSILDAGRAAGGKIAQYQQLGNALEGSYTGAGAEAFLQLRRVGAALGFDVGDVSDEELATSLGNKIALELRNPAGGAGMPGAMSDTDREFLVSSVPGLSKTPEGNRKLVEMLIKVEERNQQIGELAREYMGRNNGRLDVGFYDELAAFSEANPMFDVPASGPIEGVPQSFSEGFDPGEGLTVEDVWNAMTPEQRALWQN